MTTLEGPATGWLLTKLGPVGKWLQHRVARDHLPITGRQGRPDLHYYAFYVFTAVAPSQSPKPLPLVDFADRARELVEEAFPGDFPPEPDYSGHELVRYRCAVEGIKDAEHRITIYPTGLVELQWIIAAPPNTGLLLADAVTAVRRLHRAVQGSTFLNLHRPRWLERWRCVDWRIGVNGRATPTDGTNTVSWTDIVTMGRVPQRRTADPRPYCPPTGYATDRLTSLRRSVELDRILAPVLEELFASGGYVGGVEIRESVADLLAAAI